MQACKDRTVEHRPAYLQVRHHRASGSPRMTVKGALKQVRTPGQLPQQSNTKQGAQNCFRRCNNSAISVSEMKGTILRGIKGNVTPTESYKLLHSSLFSISGFS